MKFFKRAADDDLLDKPYLLLAGVILYLLVAAWLMGAKFALGMACGFIIAVVIAAEKEKDNESAWVAGIITGALFLLGFAWVKFA